jgi:hypothetical protein
MGITKLDRIRKARYLKYLIFYLIFKIFGGINMVALTGVEVSLMFLNVRRLQESVLKIDPSATHSIYHGTNRN